MRSLNVLMFAGMLLVAGGAFAEAVDAVPSEEAPVFDANRVDAGFMMQPLLLNMAEAEKASGGPFVEWWNSLNQEWVGFFFVILAPLGLIQFVHGGVGGSGGFDPCFIATAAYGTPLAGEIDTLRAVRDTYFLNNAVGAAFVDGYYHVSPPIAGVVARHPMLAAAVRVVLMPVIWVSRLTLAMPYVTLAGFVVLLIALHRRRRLRSVR